jgi:hypothetical protein
MRPQQLLQESLSRGARLATNSAVAVLDELLVAHRQGTVDADAIKIGSHFAPIIGH